MKRIKRMILGLAVLLVAAFVLICGALYAMQDRMIFPAPSGPNPTALVNADLQEIVTPDGERLAALWHAAEPGEGTVIFLHGNGTAIANLEPMIDALADRGFGVLVAAWRGYPGSTGRSSEQGIFIDAIAIHDFARARTDGPLAVVGESLGSGAAVHLAIEREADALVLVSPYDSVRAVASARFPFLPVGTLLRHPFRSDERIADVDEPILIVHGTADQVIPINHGRALHARAPAGAEFVEVPGATHFDILDYTFGGIAVWLAERFAAVSNGARSG